MRGRRWKSTSLWDQQACFAATSTDRGLAFFGGEEAEQVIEEARDEALCLQRGAGLEVTSFTPHRVRLAAPCPINHGGPMASQTS